MSNQSTSGGLDKCSFCNKKDDEEPFLENDDHTACICQGCALMFADHISDGNKEDNADEEFSQPIIPDWESVDKSSLKYKLSILINSINDDAWFPTESPCSFNFPDGVIVVAEEEQIDDPNSFLEIYDEMDLYRSSEFNGVSFADDELITELLEVEGNMWLFTFTFNFGNAKDPDGNLICSANDEQDLRVRYLQFGAGEVCGYSVIISSDHNTNSLNKWIDNIDAKHIKVAPIHMLDDQANYSSKGNATSKKIKLEFAIQRAEINMDDIEDDDVKEKLDNVIALVKAKKNDDAVKALPTLTFEWSWSNGDADPSDYFVDTDDISFELNTQNSTLQVGVSNGSLVLTCSVFFELDIKEDVDLDDVQDWLDENSMVYCGFVAGGWSYNGDEGTSISVCLESVESNSDIRKMSKVVFNVEFSNGDTYEKEKKSFEFMLPDLFSESLDKVRNEKNQAELISFYKTIMAEDSPCYKQILTTFADFGYRKLGWGDVMVDFDSIEIDGHLVEWGDELFDFRNDLQIQLAPSDEGHMMYLCN